MGRRAGFTQEANSYMWNVYNMKKRPKHLLPSSTRSVYPDGGGAMAMMLWVGLRV